MVLSDPLLTLANSFYKFLQDDENDSECNGYTRTYPAGSGSRPESAKCENPEAIVYVLGTSTTRPSDNTISPAIFDTPSFARLSENR